MNVRDHLANERTFLAWVRTSIALLGFGVLIAKLRLLGLNLHAGVRSTLLGLAFAAVGLITLPFAAWRYETTRRRIDSGDYRSAAHLIFAFTAVIFGLGLACIAYLIVILK